MIIFDKTEPKTVDVQMIVNFNNILSLRCFRSLQHSSSSSQVTPTKTKLILPPTQKRFKLYLA